MDASAKICFFCRKSIASNPVTVTAKNGAVRHYHFHCSNGDRSEKKLRVIDAGPRK